MADLEDLTDKLTERIANLDNLDKLLVVQNAVNTLKIHGFFDELEFTVITKVLEQTRDYLMMMERRG